MLRKTVLILLLIPLTSYAGDVEEALTPDQELVQLYQQGRYKEATKIGERTLAIREKTLGPEHPDTAISLNNLAALYYSMGAYSKAELLYKRGLAISEKSLGPEHPQTATYLNNLGDLYRETGEYSKAGPLLKRALAKREKILGPEHPDTTMSLNNLAALYYSMGDYSKAGPLYKKALAIAEKSLGPEHPNTAASLNNLAELYRAMGEYSRAGPLYKRALAIAEKTLGPEHPDTAKSLSNLALLYSSMGAYSKAEQLHKRVLAIREKSLGPEHPDTAASLNNLAELYRAMGEYSRAGPLYKRGLAIAEKSLGPEHPQTATFLNNLAELYREMGVYSQAEPLYKRALAIAEKSLGPEHPDTAIFLNNLAELYGRQGRNRESLNMFKRGLKADERVIQNVFAITYEAQKLRFVKKLSGRYERALSLIHQKFSLDQDALRTGLDLVLSRKGIVFDSQARQRETIANSLGPKAKGLWVEFASFRARLAKLLQRKPANLSFEEYRSQIRVLNTKIEALESQLSAMSGLVAEELEQRKVTTEKVAGRLRKDSVLAEFVKIHDYDWKKSKWAAASRYLVFVLHPDEKIELINFGEADKLEKDIQAALKYLKMVSLNKRVMKKHMAASERLFTILWKPIIGSVENAISVIISPDGLLNLVPFGAIRDDEGKYLIESKLITYVTSGRDLLRGDTVIRPETDLFLAANPKFDLTAKAGPYKRQDIPFGKTRPSDFFMTWGPLPGTALEAETIPELIPGKAKKVVTGEDATELAVLSIKRPRVLHLATHGFFLEDQPELALSNERGFSERPVALPKGYENPLVRSGLALAGANHAMESTTSIDGLLTALEVSGMDLHGTDLVTLSACETGVGEIKVGEGVFGLRRAFALSGARNLLMSLWPISDKITAQQMTTFYRLYGEGKAPSNALRQAQLKTISKLREKHGFAPPALWAPFILQGPPD